MLDLFIQGVSVQGEYVGGGGGMGGVYVLGGICPAGAGGSVQGVSVQGGKCPGGSVQG